MSDVPLLKKEVGYLEPISGGDYNFFLNHNKIKVSRRFIKCYKEDTLKDALRKFQDRLELTLKIAIENDDFQVANITKLTIQKYKEIFGVLDSQEVKK